MVNGNEDRFFTLSLDLICVANFEGYFTRVNPSFIEVLGYTEDQLLATSFLEFVHPDDRASTLAEVEKLAGGEAVISFVNRYRCADGSYRYLSWKSKPDVDQQAIYAVARDVTAEREAEEELRRAKEEAERANRVKSGFLASMSHELRTPLNAILGFAQILDRLVDPHLRQNVRPILRAGEHLLGLINDVLELSKIEAARATLNSADVDLKGLLEFVEETFSAQADSKSLVLQFEVAPTVPSYVRTDHGKLRQLLINLISNAVKFTERGRVTVGIGAAPTADGLTELTVEVTDTGKGIAPEALDRIFEKFEQTAEGASQQEGTGLGLAISREFARLMGGDLTVQSTLGEGSTFRLRCRVEAVAETVALTGLDGRVVALAPDQPPIRVLVADDRADNRALLEGLLTIVGFQVRSVTNGREAVELFTTYEPRVVLMDLQMPDLDGYEAIRIIRNLPGGREVTLIAVSASVFEEEEPNALRAGADAFLRKPFREANLFTLLQSHAGVRYVTEEAVHKPSSATPPKVEIEAAIAALPASLVADCREATTSGDLERLNELLGDPVIEPAVASLLKELASRYEYDRLMRLFAAREAA